MPQDQPAAGGPADPPPWIAPILDRIDDTILVLDREWRFVYLNRHALKIAGAPPEQLLGQTIWDRFPQLRGTELEAVYRQAQASQTPAHFETVGVISRRWFEIHAYPSPEGLVIYARDIGSRKQAEQALRDSEERFRQLAETIDQVFWMTDAATGRVLYVSPAYEQLWGRTCQSLYERPDSWLGAIHPDDRPRVAAAFDRILAAGGFRQEYRIIRPDGSPRWILDRGFPVRDAESRVYRFLGLAKDITERRRAETALRESEERLGRFFEAAFEGIAIHEGGVILDANQALADLFGYSVPEMIGRHALDLAAPPSREVIRQHIQSGDERPYEAVGLRKDGSSFTGELRGKPITYQGRPARVVVVRDISERKRAEEQLRALSRRLLEVQEQERRRLARELHDEVAQVLTGLNYTLELSKRAPAAEREARLADAQRLVRELAGRVRDTSLLLRPSMLDDLGLCPALLWHIERFTAQTGVRVEFEQAGLERRFAPEVETAVYRAVQEALTNAARHAGVDMVRVRLWVENGDLYLRIEDEGAGFDAAAVLPRATGGLAGMQERITLLGGGFVLESARGAGTRLTARLPV